MAWSSDNAGGTGTRLAACSQYREANPPPRRGSCPGAGAPWRKQRAYSPWRHEGHGSASRLKPIAAARDDPRASRQEVTGARLLYDPDQFMPENERRARAAGHCERRAREAKVQPDQVQITGTQTALAHAHQAPPRPHWRRGDVSEPRRPCRGKVHPAPEPANHAAGGVLPGRAGIDQRAHQMYSPSCTVEPSPSARSDALGSSTTLRRCPRASSSPCTAWRG